MIEESYKSSFYRIQANINLDAICHNIKEERKRIPKHTKLMAVIKADGYGHGSVPIARILDPFVDCYGVAIIEEAIELRKAGITKQIIILGAIFKEQIPSVVAYDVTATVFSFDIAKQISKEASKWQKTVKLHIKIDTGMGRLGYLPTKENKLEIEQIYKLPYILAEGIFTHFACADHANKSSAMGQLKLFVDFIRELEKENIYFEIKHVANSAAIIDLPEACFDMVRSGITTYGLYPSDEVIKTYLHLLPAMEIKTYISHVKKVTKGSFIGYGSTYLVEEDKIIATIPVGYADGYPRGLSNKGSVLIHGQKANVVGRICMDQFMVDVTHISKVKVGDKVTLIGRDGNNYIPVEELANRIGSFNYEFICNISKRVPRIYYRNDVPFLVRHDI